jgi:glycosyltransferase involved in cell wall biosynthesis
MHLLWKSLIEPALKALGPKYILEIGSDFGENTRNLLKFCSENDAVLHAVDPFPQFDVSALEKEYPDSLFFYQTLSLNAIDRIEKIDAALIDGDHNWYTLINELRLIEHNCHRRNINFPIIFTHDTGWPYARRDLYYNPESIPEAYRKPFKKQGLHPGSADLVEKGGINAHLFNAIHENTFQNGILTAIEDFLKETSEKIIFKQVEGLNGLGILIPQKIYEQNHKLAALIDKLDLAPEIKNFIEQLEAIRIEEQIQKNNLRHKKKELAENLGQTKKELSAKLKSLQQSEQQISDLKKSESRLEQQNKNQENEIAKLRGSYNQLLNKTVGLSNLFEGLNQTTAMLFSSRRWRFSKAIGETLRIATLRPRRPMAADKILNIEARYQDWKKDYNDLVLKQKKQQYNIQTPAAISRDFHSTPCLSEEALRSVYIQNSELYYRYHNRAADKKVSVIMPTYNSIDVIDKAIGSVLDQYHDNFELIIIDDGSTDNTQQHVAKQYNDPRISYHYIENHGPAYARNHGLKHASGHYIAYLDSDNQWFPEYLTVMTGMLEDHPEVLMGYCAQEIYNGDLLVDIRFMAFNRSLLMNKNYIDINCVVHRQKLYETMGGFDADLPRLEDWDLVLRYTEKVFPIFINAPLVKYYKSDHYKNPLKDPRRQKARKRLEDSIRRIQEKLKTDPLELSFPDNLPVFRQTLFSPTTLINAGKTKHKVSIIIPGYEALDCLKLCVEAIEAYTDKSCYEIIIVDNASSGPVIEFLGSLEQKDDKCRVIYNDTNMGFTYAVNQGIKAADPCHDIVLLNNDAIVTRGWLQAFAEVLEDVTDAGIIAPQQVLPPETDTMQAHVPFCTPQREVDVTLSAHHKNLAKMYPINWTKGYRVLDWATFFCVYITRACIAANGLLDHRNGRHFKSDKIYCRKAVQKNNFQVIYTPAAKVYHLVQQATKELKIKNPEQYKLIYEKNAWDKEDEDRLDNLSVN